MNGPKKKIDYGLHEWNVDHEENLSEFICEAKMQYSDIESDISLLKEKKYALLEHPGNSIDRVLSRIKLVQCLKREMDYTEIYNKTIEAGMYADCGTYIYLVITCFDILGRDPSFRSLENWIKSKKVIKSIVNSLKSTPLKEVLINKITEYNNVYGMKQSFRRFFCSFLQNSEKSYLFKHYWVTKNKNLKNHGIHLYYSTGPDEPWKLLAQNPEDCLKKIADKIADIRNKFSHAGIVLPPRESDYPAVFSHIIKIKTRPTYRCSPPVYTSVSAPVPGEGGSIRCTSTELLFFKRCHSSFLIS